MQSFSVIGVMVGYIVGSTTVTFFGQYLSWRFAFMFQGWFMLAVGIGFLFCDNKALDIFVLMRDPEYI